MNPTDVIRHQYRATLAMLKEAVVQCPAGLWDAESHKNRFWHVAYHVLFYTHLYLQDSEKSFTPWTKHREEHNFLGPLPWPPHKKPVIGEPYSRREILEYLELCQGQVEERVASLNLEAESGFHWLPFSKLELQFYNIRHLQHHTGQLVDRLRSEAGIGVRWVGTMPEPAGP